MRDDQISASLRQANPWWLAATLGNDATAWTQSHRAFRDRARYDLGYRSTVLDDVAHDVVDDRLVVLTGPRRVGKSIALLDAAAALCSPTRRATPLTPCASWSTTTTSHGSLT